MQLESNYPSKSMPPPLPSTHLASCSPLCWAPMPMRVGHVHLWSGGEGGVLGFLRFEGLHHDIPFGGYLCAKDLLALDP